MMPRDNWNILNCAVGMMEDYIPFLPDINGSKSKGRGYAEKVKPKWEGHCKGNTAKQKPMVSIRKSKRKHARRASGYKGK